jgi:hypothetical protein
VAGADDEPALDEDELALEDDEGDPLLDSLGVERLSVTYHPLPLNTIPTGCSTRRSSPPQPLWVVSGGSEKRCLTSMCSSQLAQAYS